MKTLQLKDCNLLVIGLGLIGGSLAKDCVERKVFNKVIGYSRKSETMAKAKELGLINDFEADLETAVSQSDVIFISVPILTTEKIIAAIAPYLKTETILTDGGSSKESIVESARQFLSTTQFENFVPGHPIAGAENSGVHAARANLYQNQKIILTPEDETNKTAISIVKAMWQAVGGQVDLMSPQRHDSVLAATSHLPHLLAFNLVDSLAKNSDYKDIFNYAAGGFRDFTRIAASDPVMWHDIFQANQKSVLTALDQFLSELHRLRDAVEKSDGDYMKKVFMDAKVARDHFSKILEARNSGCSEE